MGKTRLRLAASLLWLSLALPAVHADEMPSLLTTRLDGIDKTYPTWVAARVATKPDGSLDPGLFHPVLLEGLTEALETPVDPTKGCIPQGEDFQSWAAPPDVSSLEATFRSSRRVLRARVVDSEIGFDRATPGTLFKIELLESLKGDNDLATYFFFAPVGRVKVGQLEICKTDYRFPVIPQIGNEVVLLVPKAAPGDPLLDLPFEQGLVVLRDDEASLPGFKNIREAKAVPRSELLAELARLAKENGR